MSYTGGFTSIRVYRRIHQECLHTATRGALSEYEANLHERQDDPDRWQPGDRACAVDTEPENAAVEAARPRQAAGNAA